MPAPGEAAYPPALGGWPRKDGLIHLRNRPRGDSRPGVAYSKALHELKLITDLIWEGGIERMHYSISDTAEYGSHAVGPNVVDEHVRENMRAVLARIQDGSFAREWIAEMDRGQPVLEEYRRALASTLLEQVGSRLRALNEREVAEAQGV